MHATTVTIQTLAASQCIMKDERTARAGWGHAPGGGTWAQALSSNNPSIRYQAQQALQVFSAVQERELHPDGRITVTATDLTVSHNLPLRCTVLMQAL
jgi:hypothetical protein